MNEQDAISILNDILQEARAYRLVPKEIKALNIAISALEKQIPKKLKNQLMCDGEIHAGDCPTCGNPLYMGLFCHECGQKIDWSGEGKDQ